MGESGQDEVSERALVWFSNVFDPRVWDYFHQLAEEGDFVFEVFDRWGLVAVDLALAPEYREVRKGVLEALRKADEMVIEALRDENLRRQPLFVELLKRDIKGGPLAKALRELQAAPAEARAYGARYRMEYNHRHPHSALGYQTCGGVCRRDQRLEGVGLRRLRTSLRSALSRTAEPLKQTL